MRKGKSEDEIEVCAVAGDDITKTTTRVEGVVLETIPRRGTYASRTRFPAREWPL
jgi:hypothetical protein